MREEEPPRPSQRLSTSQSKASIAAVRQTDPEKLSKLIQGELDWIVMKALEKDRSRRYETANGFAADVQRYLAGEQVQAVPPSATYRLTKFVRKNGVILATATAFALLLIIATAVSSYLAVQAKRAEAFAEEKRIEAQANAEEADHNAWLYAGAAMNAETARQEAELAAASRQIDLDLVEGRTDQRIGLLRLLAVFRSISGDAAKKRITTPFGPKGPMQIVNTVFSEQRELRQFIAAAVLAGGQEFAPLLPPITHDGHAVIRFQLSADGLTLLTLGADGTARLWDVRTTTPIATLRKTSEQVLRCGLSQDGKTAFTDASDGVVRLWDTTDGSYRAETEPRPAHVCPESAQDYAGVNETTQRTADATHIHNTRLITRSVAKGFPELLQFTGPVELWDTATGEFITGLDRPNTPAEQFRFLGDGRWISTIEGETTVLLFSAEDGRLLARLEHPVGETVQSVDASPTVGQVATASLCPDGKSLVRLWDAGSWKAKPGATPVESAREFRFWTENTFTTKGNSGLWDVQRFGDPKPLAWFSGVTRPLLVEDRVQIHGTEVCDFRTWQLLRPPPGRRFHPDLVRFAPDGRFAFFGFFPFIGSEVFEFIDTRTEKEIHLVSGWEWDSPPRNLPGFGLVWISKTKGQTGEIRLLPSPDRLDLPPELLELWAQVAVRGELGDDGRFVKWDEMTWEKKRQELAATPAPGQSLPFPGHVAKDRLHWLRSEYFAASNDLERQQLAQRFLRRVEENGDHSEADRWRTILTPAVNQEAKPVSK